MNLQQNWSLKKPFVCRWRYIIIKRFLIPKPIFLIFQVKLSPHLLAYDDKSDQKTKEQSVVEEIGMIDVFKNGYTRKVTLIMFFNWIVVTLGI